jgi:hypothetical protein
VAASRIAGTATSFLTWKRHLARSRLALSVGSTLDVEGGISGKACTGNSLMVAQQTGVKTRV